MAVTPIPVHLVYTVFQYILPPSLPIPPHLLSRSLVKRHHFLSISPADPASYLCWPSSQRAQVTEALESTPREGLTSQPEHDVRYSAPDQETLLAHVRPHHMSPLQIVFVWDTESESWRYHDARMLPFPDSSLCSLDLVLAQWSKTSSGLSPNELGGTSHDMPFSSPTSNVYWAGYDTDSPPVTPPHATAGEDEKAEEGYWDSYCDVHGSGDSTVPSPLPGDLRGPDIPTDPLISHLLLRLHEHNELSSPRLSSCSEFPVHQLSVPTENSTFVGSNVMNDEYYGDPEVDDMKIIESHHEDDKAYVTESMSPSNDRRESDEGAKDAVRGIYRMWKAHAPSADASVFIEVVKSALETV